MGEKIDKDELLHALREIKAIHVAHLAALEGLVKLINERLAAMTGEVVKLRVETSRPAMPQRRAA